MLVLDVGPSMHSILPEVEKVCSMLVEKKVFPLTVSYRYLVVSNLFRVFPSI